MIESKVESRNKLVYIIILFQDGDTNNANIQIYKSIQHHYRNSLTYSIHDKTKPFAEITRT